VVVGNLFVTVSHIVKKRHGIGCEKVLHLTESSKVIQIILAVFVSC